MSSCNYAGGADVLADGKEVTIVEAGHASSAGCDGLATVHVSCADIDGPIPVAGEETQNAMVRLTIRWQSGCGGGEFEVDCTQGTMFTVGGSEVIGVTARLVSTIEGVPLVPWAAKRVEANVHWSGSTYGEAMMSLPSVTLVEIAEGSPLASPFQRIPLQAKSMIALGTSPALFPGLTAEFSTSDDVSGTGVKYATLNPNANGTPIVHGVEFVRFRSDAAQTVFGVFELYP